MPHLPMFDHKVGNTVRLIVPTDLHTVDTSGRVTFVRGDAIYLDVDGVEDVISRWSAVTVSK